MPEVDSFLHKEDPARVVFAFVGQLDLLVSAVLPADVPHPIENVLRVVCRNFIEESKNKDRKYSYEIWQMLQGDVYEYCGLANLIRVLFCLLGCWDADEAEQAIKGLVGEACN